MAVSKNKRRNGKVKKLNGHQKMVMKRKKKMQEINQGPSFYLEIRENANVALNNARLLISNYFGYPWKPETPAETITEYDNLVNRHTVVINELEGLLSSTYTQHIELQAEMAEKKIDLIDANFRYIELTTAVIESLEYVISQSIVDIERAYLAKVNDLNAPLQ